MHGSNETDSERSSEDFSTELVNAIFYIYVGISVTTCMYMLGWLGMRSCRASILGVNLL